MKLQECTQESYTSYPGLANRPGIFPRTLFQLVGNYYSLSKRKKQELLKAIDSFEKRKKGFSVSLTKKQKNQFIIK